MRQKSGTRESSSERLVKNIRRVLCASSMRKSPEPENRSMSSMPSKNVRVFVRRFGDFAAG